MQSHNIEGGGGVSLHVEEAGNRDGRPILFIHGFSQCGRAWDRQTNSDLAEDHRLVAMDIRGHGRSDKPRDAYGDAQLWADDVRAVINALELDHPILSGWSYGPLVMLDYVRHHGEDAIGGMNFVGGVTKIGTAEALTFLTPEFVGLVPGFFSEDPAESERALRSLLKLCFETELGSDDLERMVEYNTSVPYHVRQGLFSRVVDNDDLLPKIRKPVLISQGKHDRVVKPVAAGQHKTDIPHAEIDMMNTGHACFWDDAAAFNDRLRRFTERVFSSTASAG